MAFHFLGVDPDMHFMPIVDLAVPHIDGPTVVSDISVVEVPGNLKGRDALRWMAKGVYTLPVGNFRAYAVEAQEIYQSGPGKTKNPKSIMFLATVAGMMLSKLSHNSATGYFPAPFDWKGNAPKQIHQARVLSRLGMDYDKVGTVEDGYCVPKGALKTKFSHFKKSDWKHVVDAIGLALFAREQYEKETRSAEFRATQALGRRTITTTPKEAT